jgi:hypothetical protein
VSGVAERWCTVHILFIIHIIMIYESDNTGHYKENVKYMGVVARNLNMLLQLGGGGGRLLFYLYCRHTYCKNMPSREN